MPLCRCPRRASSTAPRGCICREGSWGDSPASARVSSFRNFPAKSCGCSWGPPLILVPLGFAAAFPLLPVPCAGLGFVGFCCFVSSSPGCSLPPGSCRTPPWARPMATGGIGPAGVRRWMLLAAGLGLEPAQQSLRGLSSGSPLRLAPAPPSPPRHFERSPALCAPGASTGSGVWGC